MRFIVQMKQRRECGVDTKKGYVEILEFTHFVRFFRFDYIGENHKEKVLVNTIHRLLILRLYAHYVISFKEDLPKCPMSGKKIGSNV